MRLIDADALKKDIDTEWLTPQTKMAFFKIIDNAPTVEAYPFEQVQELVKLNQQFAQEIENLKRPQGDLISRSELKKALKSNCKPELCHDYNTAWCDSCCRTHDFEDLIDNAPAVEIPKTIQQAINFGIFHAENQRPQGEWENDSDNLPICNKCGEIALQRIFVKMPHLIQDVRMVRSNYCPNCGADMRKGGAE